MNKKNFTIGLMLLLESMTLFVYGQETDQDMPYYADICGTHPLFDEIGAYEYASVRFSYPAGYLTKKNRVGVWLYVINCNTEDTMEVTPLVFYEGESYHKRRIKRIPNFSFPTNTLRPFREQDFEIDTLFQVKRQKRYKAKYDYLAVVEDYKRILREDYHHGTCLEMRPFRFLQPLLWEIPNDTIYQLFEETIRSKKPATHILKPFVDFNIKRLNVHRNVSVDSTIVLNRIEVVYNLAAAYHIEHKQDSALYLLNMLKDMYLNDYHVKLLESLFTFKKLYFKANRTMKEEMEYINALNNMMSIDYYRAVLYTELGEFRNREEALTLLEKMDDNNPIKWYLMAIIWAEREKQGPQEGQEPYYQTCLRRSFFLDKSFLNLYMMDAQFSDELRNKYPQLEILSKKNDSIFFSPRKFSDNPSAFYMDLYRKKRY